MSFWDASLYIEKQLSEKQISTRQRSPKEEPGSICLGISLVAELVKMILRTVLLKLIGSLGKD